MDIPPNRSLRCSHPVLTDVLLEVGERHKEPRSRRLAQTLADPPPPPIQTHTHKPLPCERSHASFLCTARSPLYSHISATIQGLPTIRTFSQEPAALDAFHVHQDSHSQVWYLCLAATRWFGMRIDLLNVAFLAAVAFISIPLSSSMAYRFVNLKS